MTQHRAMPTFDRRQFLTSAAGFTLALTVAPEALTFADEALAEAPGAPGAPASLTAWVTIAPDGATRSCRRPPSWDRAPSRHWRWCWPTSSTSIGRRSRSATRRPGMRRPTAIRNSELHSHRGQHGDARLLHADADRRRAGAPRAARCRSGKMERAGRRTHDRAERGAARPSRRRISYGEIAAFAKAPAELPKIADTDLKRPEQFRYIGKDVLRTELPLKVTGAAKYGMDAEVPGMVYATVLHSPYFGGAPETVDDTAARQVPGVTDVVRLPDGVGIVGATVEATLAARGLVKVGWSNAPAAAYDSERALEEFEPSLATRPAPASHSAHKAMSKPRWRAPPRS